MPRSHRPFTLIELLVVISIIAILAAMLLPVLGRAKRTAIIALCTNNQRQIGIMMTTYAGDSNSWLPVNRQPNTNRTMWIFEETKGMFEEQGGNSISRLFSCPALRTHQPDSWCCPSTDYSPTVSWATPMLDTFPYIYPSGYVPICPLPQAPDRLLVPTGYNIWAGRVNGYWGTAPWMPVRVGQEPRMGGGSTPTPWMTDVGGWWSNYPLSPVPFTSHGGYHWGRGSNSLEADGSVHRKAFRGFVADYSGDPEIVKFAGDNANKEPY